MNKNVITWMEGDGTVRTVFRKLALKVSLRHPSARTPPGRCRTCKRKFVYFGLARSAPPYAISRPVTSHRLGYSRLLAQACHSSCARDTSVRAALVFFRYLHSCVQSHHFCQYRVCVQSPAFYADI